MFQENHEKPIINPLRGSTTPNMIKTMNTSSSRGNMRSDEEKKHLLPSEYHNWHAHQQNFCCGEISTIEKFADVQNQP
jgi:hypothetical protein